MCSTVVMGSKKFFIKIRLILDYGARGFPSPPCGMATVFPECLLTVQKSSEPTVWDGDTYFFTFFPCAIPRSKPTVWDGDCSDLRCV